MALTMSEQPRKQRKARFAAPLHLRQRLVHAHLSKEARAKMKTKRRSLAVREGDKVKVMRGKFRGHTGKVTEVDLKSLKIYVEGVVARKAKGAEVPAPIEPSNVMIMDLEMSDKRRKEIVEGGIRNQGFATRVANISPKAISKLKGAVRNGSCAVIAEGDSKPPAVV